MVTAFGRRGAAGIQQASEVDDAQEIKLNALLPEVAGAYDAALTGGYAVGDLAWQGNKLYKANTASSDPPGTFAATDWDEVGSGGKSVVQRLDGATLAYSEISYLTNGASYTLPAGIDPSKKIDALIPPGATVTVAGTAYTNDSATESEGLRLYNAGSGWVREAEGADLSSITEMTSVDAIAGTSTTSQLISPKVLDDAIKAVAARITGQILTPVSATFAGLPTVDPDGNPANNGDVGVVSPSEVGTGTTENPQYPAGFYLYNGTAYDPSPIALLSEFGAFTQAQITSTAGDTDYEIHRAPSPRNLDDWAGSRNLTPQLWLPMTAVAIDLANTGDSYELHINAATPAGVLTLASLTDQVGKTLIIHNYTDIARTFTPGQPTQNSSGTATTTFTIGPREVFQGRVEDIGGTPTLVQLPASIGSSGYEIVNSNTVTRSNAKYKSGSPITYDPPANPSPGDYLTFRNTASIFTGIRQTFSGSVELTADISIVVPGLTVAPGFEYTLTYNGTNWNVASEANGAVGGSTATLNNTLMVGGITYVVQTTAPGTVLRLGSVPIGIIRVVLASGSTDSLRVEVDGGANILSSENFTANNFVEIPISRRGSGITFYGSIQDGALANSRWNMFRDWAKQGFHLITAVDTEANIDAIAPATRVNQIYLESDTGVIRTYDATGIIPDTIVIQQPFAYVLNGVYYGYSAGVSTRLSGSIDPLAPRTLNLWEHTETATVADGQLIEGADSISAVVTYTAAAQYYEAIINRAGTIYVYVPKASFTQLFTIQTRKAGNFDAYDLSVAGAISRNAAGVTGAAGLTWSVDDLDVVWRVSIKGNSDTDLPLRVWGNAIGVPANVNSSIELAVTIFDTYAPQVVAEADLKWGKALSTRNAPLTWVGTGFVFKSDEISGDFVYDSATGLWTLPPGAYLAGASYGAYDLASNEFFDYYWETETGENLSPNGIQLGAGFANWADNPNAMSPFTLAVETKVRVKVDTTVGFNVQASRSTEWIIQLSTPQSWVPSSEVVNVNTIFPERTLTIAGATNTFNGAASVTVREGIPTALLIEPTTNNRISAVSIDVGTITLFQGTITVTAGTSDAVITVTEQPAVTTHGVQLAYPIDKTVRAISATASNVNFGVDLSIVDYAVLNVKLSNGYHDTVVLWLDTDTTTPALTDHYANYHIDIQIAASDLPNGILNMRGVNVTAINSAAFYTTGPNSVIIPTGYDPIVTHTLVITTPSGVTNHVIGENRSLGLIQLTPSAGQQFIGTPVSSTNLDLTKLSISIDGKINAVATGPNPTLEIGEETPPANAPDQVLIFQTNNNVYATDVETGGSLGLAFTANSTNQQALFRNDRANDIICFIGSMWRQAVGNGDQTSNGNYVMRTRDLRAGQIRQLAAEDFNFTVGGGLATGQIEMMNMEVWELHPTDRMRRTHTHDLVISMAVGSGWNSTDWRIEIWNK